MPWGSSGVLLACHRGHQDKGVALHAEHVAQHSEGHCSLTVVWLIRAPWLIAETRGFEAEKKRWLPLPLQLHRCAYSRSTCSNCKDDLLLSG